MNKLEVIYKNIDDLIPYVNNSRTHSDEQIAQIAASIKEFGWTNPVLMDGENGIIAGHGRVLAARKLNQTEIPVIELEHLNDVQKRAYIIADNKLALNAGWSEDILALELKDIEELGFDISFTGFNADEIKLLIPELNKGLTDDDVAPEPPINPVTVFNDIWIMDKHRLMCGDSTSVDAVEKLMAGQKADMVFTSPPYNADAKAGQGDIFNKKRA